MFFNEQKNAYDAGKGPVHYLDGSSLLRPFDMPKPQLAIMGLFVVAAMIIGGFLFYNIYDKVINAGARAQATVEENLLRPAAIETLPVLSSLVGLSNEEITATFAAAGYTILPNPSLSDENGALDLIKLPADVDVAQAATMYLKGIPSLTAAEATLLLNGSWNLTSEPGDALNMRVKYADFTSGSVINAVLAAATTEGFDISALGEPGVDEAGNTFLEGTVLVGEQTYNWRVSAIDLSVMYKVKGLPESAVYVGIRLYQ